MKEKFKAVIMQTISALIAMALVLGSWALGYLGGKSIVWTYVGVGLFIIIVLFICVNLVLTQRFNKKMSGLSPKDGYALGMKYKESVEKDATQVEKKVNKTIKFAYLYLCSLILLTMMTSFSIGKFDIEMSGFIVFAIILIFIEWGLVHVLISPTKYVDYPIDTLMKESEYPEIYKTVRSAAGKAGFVGNIDIYLVQTGISIATRGNKAAITVNPEELSFLTKDELYAVMLHEFAHYRNKDTKRGDYYETLMQKWDYGEISASNSIVGLANIMLLSYASICMAFYTSMFQVLTSREREIGADNFVKECGASEDYVNATAKAVLFSMYNDIAWKETTYDVYSSDKVCENYIERNIENFENKLEINKANWCHTLENELPAMVDSHPTFKMRMDSMGINVYDLYQRETNEKYMTEQERARKTIDKQIVDNFNIKGNVTYAQAKKDNYDERKTVMDAYDKAMADGKPMPADELLKSAEAFYNIDNEKAIIILKKIIAENPESGVANYYIGVILSDIYDNSCIEHLYKAIDDSSYAEAAIDAIGKYALKIGDKKMLEEYRAKAVNIKQLADEKLKRSTIKTGDKLIPVDLSDERTKQICDTVVEYFKDFSNDIYVAKKSCEDMSIMNFAVSLRAKIDYLALKKAYEDCTSYFSRLSEKTERCDLFIKAPTDYAYFEFLKIKRVKDSRIYKKSNKEN